MNNGKSCLDMLWSLYFWRHSKPVLTWSYAICSRWLCLNRGLDQMTSRGYLQPQPFCDSRGVQGSIRQNKAKQSNTHTQKKIIKKNPNQTKVKQNKNKQPKNSAIIWNHPRITLTAHISLYCTNTR